MSDIIKKIQKELRREPTGDRALTPEQAAEYLPFGRKAVLNMIKRKEIGFVSEKPDSPRLNRYWVYLSEIRDWLKEHKV